MRTNRAFRLTALGELESRIALSHVAAAVADGKTPGHASHHAASGHHGQHQHTGAGHTHHGGKNLGGHHHK